MVKKLITLTTLASLSLSLSLIPANAAAKAGAKCTKVGITGVVKGKSYTCVKTGKKLVWQLNSKNSTTTQSNNPVAILPISELSDPKRFLNLEK